MQAQRKQAPCVIVPSTPVQVPAQRKAVPRGTVMPSEVMLHSSTLTMVWHSRALGGFTQCHLCEPSAISRTWWRATVTAGSDLYKYTCEIVFFQWSHFAIKMGPVWPVSHRVPPPWLCTAPAEPGGGTAPLRLLCFGTHSLHWGQKSLDKAGFGAG